MEISTYKKFSELPPDAQALAVDYRELNPFVCDIWLQNFERYLVAENEEVAYVVGAKEGSCQMLLPLLVTRMSKLRIPKIRSMANFYTTIFSPLFTSDVEVNEAGEQLADYLQTEYSNVALFEFEPLRDHGLVEFVAEYGSENKAWQARRYHKHINRYESVQGDNFSEYLARRPSQLKNTIRRKKKLLEKETKSELSFYATSADVAEQYRNFCLVYEESWKGEESHPEFIDEILQDLARIGKARLAILFVDGEAAAAQIWFKIGTAWGVFKLAYRPKYKRYSVGTLLTAGTIEHLLTDSSVSEIDFLSGDDAYKRDWVDSQREHYGVELINGRTMAGKVLALKRRLRG